jgi:glutathione S-transferase
MLKVLGRKTSGNVQKVLWLLEEMGQPYEREDYGRQFNNTTTPEYLALNPNAKVPTLVDGDVVIWESNTILRYLSNKVGSALYPTQPAERSQVERWMDWQLASLNRPYVGVFLESRKPAAERNSATWDADAKELGQQLAILESALATHPWVGGRAMSIADICLGPIIHRCLDFQIELPKLPRLSAWRSTVTSRPAFQKAVG